MLVLLVAVAVAVAVRQVRMIEELAVEAVAVVLDFHLDWVVMAVYHKQVQDRRMKI